MRARRGQNEPLFFFKQYREFNGKRYQYGGEYPYSKPFVKEIKKTMKSNGIAAYFQFKRPEKKVVIWTRKL